MVLNPSLKPEFKAKVKEGHDTTTVITHFFLFFLDLVEHTTLRVVCFIVFC